MGARESPKVLMDIAAWRKEVHKAPSRGDVVQVVGRFMASLTPQERDSLPADFDTDPGTPEEITARAFELATEWLESGGANGGAILELGRISLVYAEASRRIAQLSTPRDRRPFTERWRW